MKQGIYTLGNDVVLHQIIALLNSIEVNGNNIPVCIIPYDDRCDRLRQEILQRNNPHVSIFSDQAVIDRWDQFSRSAWDSHPETRPGQYHRFGTHRRYCGFSGDFDQFIYMDADTLLLRNPDYIFNFLQEYDFLVYDFQYKDPSHVYNVSSPKLELVFTDNQIKTNIFCSGFYATRKNLWSPDQLEQILSFLKQGESEVLYPMAPDQTLLNYMIMRSGYRFINLALSLPQTEVTGCCAVSPHFEERNNLLYDKDNVLTYLHYIGLSSKLFDQVCLGNNLIFPYRDLFLHYRYLKNPEQRPVFKGSPKQWNATPSVFEKINRKLRKLIY